MRSPPHHQPIPINMNSPNFNPNRRVSITDPFLHAYPPAMSDPSAATGSDSYLGGASGGSGMSSRRSSDDQHLPGGPAHLKSSIGGGGGGGGAGGLNGSRPGSPSGGHQQQQQRFGGPTSGYEFGSSFGTSGPGPGGGGGGGGGGSGGHQHGGGAPFTPSQSAHSHANSTYRFGGPQSQSQSNQNTNNGPPPPGDSGNSYFDYSMRRHSLTNPHSNSPPRLPSIDSALPSPGLKRKPSIDDSIHDDYNNNNSSYPSNGYPPHLNSGYGQKRRGSSMAYDKMNNLSLAEQQSRRDSNGNGNGGNGSGNGSQWDDDRRGSNGSYGSSNQSQSYMSSYGMPSPGDPYDQQRGMNSYAPQQPPPHHVHRHSSMSEQNLVYDHQPMQHQQGHRQTMSMGGHPSNQNSQFSNQNANNPNSNSHPSNQYQSQHSVDPDMAYSQNRRPGMPNQQQQQQQQQQQPQGGMYGGGGGQGSGGYPGGSRGMPHSSGMLPSVTQSPPEAPGADLRGPPALPPPPPPLPVNPANNLPPAQAAWARAGPLPASAHHPHSSRHNSTSSLDPSSAYGSMGPGGKDMGGSPYSRSPELRVSHKLAERKRRKEMAQLFDELRDALPADRGLKSSKWEILSKAVDYIVSLKEHNLDLSRDNTMLRDHFGLPPGPQAPPVGGSHSPPESAYGGSSVSQQQQSQPPPQQQHHHAPSVSSQSPHPSPRMSTDQAAPPPDWQQGAPNPNSNDPRYAPPPGQVRSSPRDRGPPGGNANGGSTRAPGQHDDDDSEDDES
ncbi:hypothetical protein RQP46_000543 [Phenoliferia psychrophenolica]